ncbi:hypothetical protein N9A28_02545 [Sulfurimonas sp.]|nr:hypothetical protein [Sulfurimonas sp.]
MKNLILMILLSVSSLLQAQSFSKNNILGVWEVSSLKENGFAMFGKDNSKVRGEPYTLIFNRQGLVKNKNTSEVYNYEIINNQLKIYQTKTYKNNYKIKNKYKFDLMVMSGDFENCSLVKITKKKITGYYRKEGYKWCKVQDYPQVISYTNEDFKF